MRASSNTRFYSPSYSGASGRRLTSEAFCRFCGDHSGFCGDHSEVSGDHTGFCGDHSRLCVTFPGFRLNIPGCSATTLGLRVTTSGFRVKSPGCWATTANSSGHQTLKYRHAHMGKRDTITNKITTAFETALCVTGRKGGGRERGEQRTERQTTVTIFHNIFVHFPCSRHALLQTL